MLVKNSAGQSLIQVYNKETGQSASIPNTEVEIAVWGRSGYTVIKNLSNEILTGDSADERAYKGYLRLIALGYNTVDKLNKTGDDKLLPLIGVRSLKILRDVLKDFNPPEVEK